MFVQKAIGCFYSSLCSVKFGDKTKNNEVHVLKAFLLLN